MLKNSLVMQSLYLMIHMVNSYVFLVPTIEDTMKKEKEMVCVYPLDLIIRYLDHNTRVILSCTCTTMYNMLKTRYFKYFEKSVKIIPEREMTKAKRLCTMYVFIQ